MNTEQKIEAEAGKLYPYDKLHGASYISAQLLRRAAYIAGRSAGLEREKELEEALREMLEWSIYVKTEVKEKAKQLLNK